MKTRVPSLWWGVLAPVVVVGGLLALRSAPVVFAVYHVGLCLVAPAVAARRRGLSWRAHARELGLVRGGVGAGLGFGAAAAVVIIGVYAVWPGLYVGAAELRAAMAGWGLGPSLVWPALGFLLVVNAPAEELFWRGWLQGDGRPSRARAAALVGLFASYHGVTAWALSPDWAAVAVKLVAVAGAGVFWTWSRARWGSVWVAALSHWGAAVGYVVVGGWVLVRG